MPTVAKVRKETSSDGSHRHIAGVCIQSGTFYTRKEVVDGIDAGQTWVTSADGKTARIKKMTYCPAPECFATPYITTAPDHTTENNLENLPPC